MSATARRKPLRSLAALPGRGGPVGRSEWMDVDWSEHQRWVGIEERGVNVIDVGRETIDVTTHVWSKEHRTFVKGPHKRFKRSEYVAAEGLRPARAGVG